MSGVSKAKKQTRRTKTGTPSVKAAKGGQKRGSDKTRIKRKPTLRATPRRKTQLTRRKVPGALSGRKKRREVTVKPRRRVVSGKKRRETTSDIPEELKWVEDDPKDHLLSRFIYDSKDKVIGESIGVEGKQLIMKSGKKFYSIPLKNIKEREAALTLQGRINKRLSRKMGEVWRKKALDPLYQKKK
jgi:hypothetical protein